MTKRTLINLLGASPDDDNDDELDLEVVVVSEHIDSCEYLIIDALSSDSELLSLECS